MLTARAPKNKFFVSNAWKTVAAIRDRGVEGVRFKKKKGGQGQRGLGPRLQWDASFQCLKICGHLR